MKKLLLTGFFSFSLFHYTLSQNTIYQLHELVGDTIDIQEKKAYYLFPEFSDTSFNYSFVNQEGVNFKLITHLKNDSINIKTVEEKDLEGYSLRIQKFGDFYERKKSTNHHNTNHSLLDSQNIYQLNIGNGNHDVENNKEITFSPRFQNYKEKQEQFDQGFVIPNIEFELQFKKKRRVKNNVIVKS